MRYILIFILLLFPKVALCADWYCAYNGSGTTCSAETPCTWKYAVETKSSAGDTVHMQNGTYTISSEVTINKELTIVGDGEPTWSGAPGSAGSSASWSGNV